MDAERAEIAAVADELQAEIDGARELCNELARTVPPGPDLSPFELLVEGFLARVRDGERVTTSELTEIRTGIAILRKLTEQLRTLVRAWPNSGPPKMPN